MYKKINCVYIHIHDAICNKKKVHLLVSFLYLHQINTC